MFSPISPNTIRLLAKLSKLSNNFKSSMLYTLYPFHSLPLIQNTLAVSYKPQNSFIKFVSPELDGP